MKWNIEYYTKENGSTPVLEFLEKLPKKLAAKILLEISLLEQCGTNLREPYVKAVKGERYKGLWELRIKFASDIARVFYFTFHENTFVMLHGFQKKTDKTPAGEIDRALIYKEDYERRMRND